MGARYLVAVVGVLVVLLAAAQAAVPMRDSLPLYGPGLEELQNYVLSAINQTADPCNDFYNYSCGAWMATFQLPPGDSSYPRSIGQIQANNNDILRAICEDPSSGIVHTFYTSCTDLDAINALGTTPIDPYISLAMSVSDMESLMLVTGQLHAVEVAALFEFGVDLNAARPFFNIGQLMQGGTSISASLYSNDSVILPIYQSHVTKMFQLLGQDQTTAATSAQAVITIESALAAFQLPPDELEDPFETFNQLNLDGLQAIAPQLPWEQFLVGIGYPNATELNVLTPDFFTSMAAYISSTPIEDLQTYLAWNVLNSLSIFLGDDFLEEQYSFYGEVLMGLTSPPPRWETCVGLTNIALGDQLGAQFAAVAFSQEAKVDAEVMIQKLEHQMKLDIEAAAWMDNTTRANALQKLEMIRNFVGYPDDPDTYSTLSLSPSEYFNNVVATKSYNFVAAASGIGHVADRDAWQMSAATVNAYYDPTRNAMFFPAGILQWPYYNTSVPWAFNFGGAGVIMGHESTHGYDNEGKDYDGIGRLTRWWLPETEIDFEEKLQCVIDQYDSFEVLPGLYVNGAQTVNENVADIGGVKNSYNAYVEALGDAANDESVIPGYTNAELWFVAFAQGWCEVATDEYLENEVATNVHSPARYRVIGPLQDLPAFSEIWNCPVGSYMNPEDRCEVW